MAPYKFPYDPTIGAEILERIALGGKRSALAHVIGDERAKAEEEDRASRFPSLPTFFLWLREHPEFADDYTRACDARAEVKAAEIEDISDTPQIGEKTKINFEGEEEVTYADMIDHRRLQIETRKWTAANLSPKKYTPAQRIEHSGAVTLINATDDELVDELINLITTGRLKLPGGVQLVEGAEDDDEDFSDIA